MICCLQCSWCPPVLAAPGWGAGRRWGLLPCPERGGFKNWFLTAITETQRSINGKMTQSAMELELVRYSPTLSGTLTGYMGAISPQPQLRTPFHLSYPLRLSIVITSTRSRARMHWCAFLMTCFALLVLYTYLHFSVCVSFKINVSTLAIKIWKMTSLSYKQFLSAGSTKIITGRQQALSRFLSWDPIHLNIAI